MEEQKVTEENSIEMSNIHYFNNNSKNNYQTSLSYNDSDIDSDSDSDSDSDDSNGDREIKIDKNDLNKDQEKDKLNTNESDNDHRISIYNDEGKQIFNPNLPIGNNIILTNGYIYY